MPLFRVAILFFFEIIISLTFERNTQYFWHNASSVNPNGKVSFFCIDLIYFIHFYHYVAVLVQLFNVAYSWLTIFAFHAFQSSVSCLYSILSVSWPFVYSDAAIVGTLTLTDESAKQLQCQQASAAVIAAAATVGGNADSPVPTSTPPEHIYSFFRPDMRNANYVFKAGDEVLFTWSFAYNITGAVILVFCFDYGSLIR